MISGGQTGADRVALDFAPEFDIPHGGWIREGRGVRMPSFFMKPLKRII
ncbi:MAG: putative molybdenum carrier protein [Deltaproteobacteria bacterium]|nr:putative molybdenum carrier protein [Deltaproteobacteria bacterium]